MKHDCKGYVEEYLNEFGGDYRIVHPSLFMDMFPIDVRDAGQRTLLCHNDRGLLGSPNTLRWLLGRDSTQWRKWVDGKMKEGRREGVVWREDEGIEVRRHRFFYVWTPKNISLPCGCL